MASTTAFKGDNAQLSQTPEKQVFVKCYISAVHNPVVVIQRFYCTLWYVFTLRYTSHLRKKRNENTLLNHICEMARKINKLPDICEFMLVQFGCMTYLLCDINQKTECKW